MFVRIRNGFSFCNCTSFMFVLLPFNGDILGSPLSLLPPLAVVAVALWVFALVNIRINKINNAARNVDSILSRRQCDMFTAAEPAIFCFILINFDFTLRLLTSSVCPQVGKAGGGKVSV